MLIYNIGQLLTMEQGIGLHTSAWLRMEAGKIHSFGPMSACPDVSDDDVDARAQVVIPGFVDCHTHLANAGGAQGTFADRCRLVEEISLEDLRARIEAQIELAVASGTTTIEIKTGYATSQAAIEKCLRAIPNRPGIVRTEMSPLADTSRAHWTLRDQPRFIDALCDPEGLSVEQLRKPLLAAGVRPKLHVCVTARSEGIALALEASAISVEHLLHATQHDIDLLSRSKTIAVLLPAMAYYTKAGRFAPARALLDAGVEVALATDYNPGDAPTHSMPFVVHLAVREMGMSTDEALCAATIHAARAIAEDQRTGSITVGKDADLQLLATRDYRDIPLTMGASLVERVWLRSEPAYPRTCAADA